MKGLKNIEEVVEKVLDVKKESRDNDDILYLYVCEYFNRGVSSQSLGDFLQTRHKTACPNFESVTRTRRKVFEKRPELKPTKITKIRNDMEQVFIDYARSN